MVRWRSKRTTPVRPPGAVVAMTEKEIALLQGGRSTALKLDDLIGVAIETTDQGPAVDDMFFLLGHPGGVMVVPSEADGASVLLERLQKLPGFDNHAVIEASGSAVNHTFICWQRSGEQPAGPSVG